MTVNFRFNNGGTDVDFDDVFIRRDIFAQGNLWAWGVNNFGQLGNNTQVKRSSPVQTISGGLNWKEISADAGGAAIKTDGTLWLWGGGTYGGLGNNAQGDRSSPVQTVSGGTNWKQVSFGITSAAIKTDGTLWLWGNNYNGDLGTNNRTDRSSPVQTISGGTNWKYVTVGSSVAAIKTDGTLWLWGQNQYGQLGNNDQNFRSSPVQTIAGGTNWQQVSGGGSFNAAIKTDGTLWLWGHNSYGQLGDNTNTGFGNAKSSPVQTISGGTNWKLVECGSYHTAAIKTDGTLWLWGRNNYGQLGNNAQEGQSSPVQTISGGTNWKQVSCGYIHTAAIKTDGTLWLWGGNYSGQLGDNTQISKSSPVQTVSQGTNWKNVSCGINITAAITDLNVY